MKMKITLWQDWAVEDKNTYLSFERDYDEDDTGHVTIKAKNGDDNSEISICVPYQELKIAVSKFE